MNYGYNGKVLHINLSNRNFEIETPDEDFYRKYLGGSALNCYYLYKLIPPGIDPLSPENVLAVSAGVTTGTRIPGQSRVAISAKSPLTGFIGDSQSGGFFPAEMKFSGFDSFIFTGRSEKPVYLWVHDGQFELRDASKLWGKITGDVEDILKKELNDEKIQIAQIGPAGEKLVRFAAIMNMCNRANGRTGMGAVMGSKNLKAIVVRGENQNSINIAHPEEFKKISKRIYSGYKGSPLEGLGKLGTAISVAGLNESGQLPSYNYTSGEFGDVVEISGETIYDKYLVGADLKKQDSLGRDTCFACPVRCKRIVEKTEGQITIDKRYGGPEYETIAMLGTICGINNFYAIAKANEICNKYGMDTISCGGTIAWAMECYENGILTQDDLNGMKLNFGNSETLINIIEMIGNREGVGDILAEGSEKASKKIGKNSEQFLITSKGQELPAHMPRVKVGLGLIYAVNPFGADHMSSCHDPFYESEDPEYSVPPFLEQLGLNTPTKPRSLGETKIQFARVSQDYISLIDSLCFCQFVIGGFGGLFDPKDLPELVNHVTGWDTDLAELLAIGERKVNLMRMFNAREGFDKTNDTLPNRIFTTLQGGVTKGYKLDRDIFKKAKEQYYAQRNWEEKSGNPTKEKLADLGLDFCV